MNEEIKQEPFDEGLEPQVDGGTAVFRMRWFEIERDSLEWAYERSDDGGETWSALWEIGYRRVV